jgi:hypothetical protein
MMEEVLTIFTIPAMLVALNIFTMWLIVPALVYSSDEDDVVLYRVSLGIFVLSGLMLAFNFYWWVTQ